MEANNLKILAIDDSTDNLTTLKAVVLDALPECVLLSALNEPQGVELARTEDPDVILLEGVMTGMDGYAVCRTLKKDERLQDIPVVFLTAPMTDRDSCVKALGAGAEAFLSQPLDKQELAAQVLAMARLKAANQLRRRENEQLAALVSERTQRLARESAERIRTAEALRASEELFRKLFEDHAAVKLLIDPDTGQIIDANQAAAQFYGWSRNQLKQMKIQDINTLPPRQVREKTDRVRTGQQTHFEFRHRRADGSIRDVDVLSSNIEAKGKALLHSIIIDVTERKKAEEMLRQQNLALLKLTHVSGELLRLSSEENLEACIAKQIKEIAGAKAAIFSTYNPGNRTTTVQHVEMEPSLLEKIVRLLGRQISQIHSPVSDEMYREMTTEMIGTRRTLYEASFGAVPHSVGATIAALLNVDRFIGLAYLVDGELYGTSLLAMGKGQPDPPKEILENFIFLAAVSLRRKRAEEKLKESRAVVKSIFESTSDMIWSVDPENFGLLSFNRSLSDYILQHTGVSVKAGMRPEDMFSTDDYIRKWHEYYNRALTEGRYSTENRQPLGARSLLLTFNVLYNNDAVFGISVFGKDITERKRAEEALRESEERYKLMFESSPIAINITRGPTITYANTSYLKMFGLSSLEELQECAPMDRFSPQCRPRIMENIKRRAEGLPVQASYEAECLRKDNTRFPVLMFLARVSFTDGPATVAFVLDITERKQAEAALRESEERFRKFIENAPVAIGFASDGKASYGNEAYLQMFGFTTLEQVVGYPVTEQVAPQCRAEFADRLMRRSRGEPAVDEYEVIAMRLDGGQFPCRVTARPFMFSDGPTTLAFFFDLTEQREAEKKLEESRGKLRNLAVHLLHAREEERKKVAREMHDELGQILTALKMDLKWIEKKFPPETAQARDKIHGAVELADQTIQMVHRISSELRPGLLDDLGLAAAIEWLGGDFSRRNGIPCRVDITAAESRIGGNSSTALFRIIQEALVNVAHHAHASRASVEIWEANGVLMIRVQDDGRGVTEEQSISPLSFGLIGIRERVQSLDGEMTIVGRPGEGTTLEVTIPLPSTGALA